MHIVHTVPSLNIDDGGPSRTVTELCKTLAISTDQVTILSKKWPNKEIIEVSDLVSKFFCAFDKQRPVSALLPSGFAAALAKINEDVPISILHNNGLWVRSSHDAVTYAARKGIPIVQSPRGMLRKWARQHKMLKKGIAWRVYQQRDLQRVDVIHATSIDEMEDIRDAKIRQPIAVVPNGVESLSDPPKTAKPKAQEKTLLFLSRIDYVKGLPVLLEAWARLSPKNWKLIIAGNDFNGHLSEVKSLISRHRISNNVQVYGPAYGADKDDLFRRSNLFILPSYSENFGIVVAEALQYGLPVITTTGTPWKELLEERCGWWVDPTVSSISNALDEAIKLTDDERHLMGMRGQNLVSRKYRWEGLGSTMVEVYNWILGQGNKPTCVYCA